MRIPTLTLIPLAVLLFAFTTGVHECDHQPGDPMSCEGGDGMTYRSGATNVPSTDDCNTCSCDDGELTECTEIACPIGPAMCTGLDGVLYSHGDTSVPAPDGCNTCTCDDGTLTGCTEIGCSPAADSCRVDGVVYPHGASVPEADGCNTCTCDDGVLTGCTDMACTPPELACNVFGRSYSMGWAPSNDGCNTCSCESGMVTGTCTELACGPIPIVSCDDLPSTASDPFVVNSLSAADGSGVVVVSVGYSGGCAPHYFRLCYDPGFIFTDGVPPDVALRMYHDGQDDACDANPTEERSFDLSPLVDFYVANAFSGPLLRLSLEGESTLYSW